MQICKVRGCNKGSSREHKGRRGWCRSHYRRYYKYGSTDGVPFSKERFLLEKLATETVDCIEWPYTRCRGYGIVRINGYNKRVHRYAYEAYFKTKIPLNLVVCHRCDNPPCFNPRHLWLGTSQENSADRCRKNRTAFGPKNGMAKLTEASVLKIRADTISSQAELAKKYGVSQFNISCIKRRKTWGHLTDV